MIKRAHIDQFLAIVEAGTITAAAERLNMSQPTLSVNLAELERQIGGRLFWREKRRVRLTEFGQRLQIHARAIEREFKLAEAMADPLIGTGTHPFRLGVLSSLSTELMLSIASGMKWPRPLVLVEGSDTELRRRLERHQIDAAITTLRTGETWDVTTPLYEEDYVLMVPESHRLAGNSETEAEALRIDTMVARRSCELLAETSRFFTLRGIRPTFVLRSADDDRCMALVGAGMGITTAPASLRRQGITALAITGFTYRRQIGLIVSEGERDALELTSTLRELCEAHLEKHQINTPKFQTL